MRLVELTAEHNFGYKQFILTGLQMHRDCFRISPADEASEPFPTRATPDSFTLGILTDGNELAGVVSFQREGQTREKIRHKGLLFRMYVGTQYGGQGLGRQLINETIRRAGQLPNLEQMILTVVSTNTAAKKLYKKAGFQPFSLEKNALKDGDVYYDEEQMVLFLR